tara:strand:+ start:841 stop:1185 length:345 start_codon:yes stop_codon:yes gene_type:complete
MDPALRQALSSILTSHAKQMNNTAFDVLRATSSQSVAHDLILADATAGTLTFTLPQADTFFDRVMRIKKTDGSGNTIKIVGQSGQTIDGTATRSIAAQYATLVVITDGAKWYLL